MKQLYTLLISLLVTLTSFSQTYKIYTAKANGVWGVASTWNTIVRTDGIPKNKYIIPTGFTVTAASTYDYTTMGDLEIEVFGTLNLAAGTIFNVTQNSSIEIIGTMKTLGASAVTVGSSWKYITFGTSTLNGPVYTTFSTTGFAVLSMLPVRFLSFTATDNNSNAVVLNWATAEESNNASFQVEYSQDGRNWQKIGTVTAVEKPSSANNYSFLHANVYGTYSYYRLKQIDKDGKYEYSSVVSIKRINNNQAEVYAVNKHINIQFSKEVKGNVVVRVFNMNGLEVLQHNYTNPALKVNLTTSQLAPGLYAVQVSGNNTVHLAKKIMIN